MGIVLMFLSDEFQNVQRFDTEDEASVYRDGVETGAACCAGGLGGFVWPRDRDALYDCIPTSQIKLALEAAGVKP